MSRPVKLRKVEYVPQSKFFAPCPKRDCERWDEVNLKIEELEAMRLKDIEGLTQEECSERMQISRQTFQNIIDEARKKVTSALMEDKAISIGGGNYTKNVCNFVCLSCGREITSAFEKRESTCRYCGSTQLVCNKSCHKKCKNKSLEDCHKERVLSIEFLDPKLNN